MTAAGKILAAIFSQKKSRAARRSIPIRPSSERRKIRNSARKNRTLVFTIVFSCEQIRQNKHADFARAKQNSQDILRRNFLCAQNQTVQHNFTSIKSQD